MRLIVYLLGCLLAGVTPLLQPSSGSSQPAARVELPGTFDGCQLVSRAMTAEEERFYRQLPGVAGSFTLVGRPGEQVFLRAVTRPSHRVHTADGCYRARGYDIRHQDNRILAVAELSDQPLRWSCFETTQGERAVIVLQTIVSLTTGHNYPDVPGWYWQASFSSEDPGPWLVVTWVRPAAAMSG